jgi:hypothetical protein
VSYEETKNILEKKDEELMKKAENVLRTRTITAITIFHCT